MTLSLFSVASLHTAQPSRAPESTPMRTLIFLALLILAFPPAAQAQELPAAVHALAMHGRPKYDPGFSHFDYASPTAPKGGDVRLHALGTFDTLNGFTLKGVAAAGLGQLLDTLLVSSDDEAFTEYGLIAETIQIAPDSSWVVFGLRPEARWHDGRPDRRGGRSLQLPDPENQRSPLLSRLLRLGGAGRKGGGAPGEVHLCGGREPGTAPHHRPAAGSSQTLLGRPGVSPRPRSTPLSAAAPTGSSHVDPGRSVTYERVADYWARDLPVNRGRHNFDLIRYDYYRDETVALEAFKAGQYDFRLENISKNWATAYDTPALSAGLMRKEEIPHERPTGMQAFVFNTAPAHVPGPPGAPGAGLCLRLRVDQPEPLLRPVHPHPQLFFQQRTGRRRPARPAGARRSWNRSAARFRRRSSPRSTARRTRTAPATSAPICAPRGQPPPAGRLGLHGPQAGQHSNRRRALHVRNPAAIQPTWERIALPFAKNLERLGIEARVRTVDTAQYQKRMEEFDFDMIVDVFGQSLSPGNEQRDFWGSKAAADSPAAATPSASRTRWWMP